MPSDLEAHPAAAIDLCRAAHARLGAAVEGLTDEEVLTPSRLPGWTVAHVLTHLARNADGHVRRLEGALRGVDVPRYPGGPARRSSDIAEGVHRSAQDIVADVAAAQRLLEEVLDRSEVAGWPHPEWRGDDQWPTTASPVRRLREVEMHHVDLGLGYDASAWPADYVIWELPVLLDTVPSRVPRLDDMRILLAWLAGRGPAPTDVELSPW